MSPIESDERRMFVGKKVVAAVVAYRDVFGLRLCREEIR